MWWRRSTERVRIVSLSMFHLGAGDGFLLWVLFCVCFVFCWFGCLFAVVGLVIRLCTISSFIHKL